MKITLEEDERLSAIEVDIRVPRIDDKVAKMVALLRSFDAKITGTKDGRTYVLDLDAILYIECVDGRTFLYAGDAVYESRLSLAELEERLAGTSFVRASRQMMVNLRHVESLVPEMGARIRMRLGNGEDAMVSRKYAPEVKRRLGLI